MTSAAKRPSRPRPAGGAIYAGVPKGRPADRKAWFEAAFNAALSWPELQAEYAAAVGGIMNREIGSAQRVSDEVNRLFAKEPSCLVKSPRAK